MNAILHDRNIWGYVTDAQTSLWRLRSVKMPLSWCRGVGTVGTVGTVGSWYSDFNAIAAQHRENQKVKTIGDYLKPKWRAGRLIAPGLKTVRARGGAGPCEATHPQMEWSKDELLSF